MSGWTTMWAQALMSDAPALPSLGAAQLWLTLGWGIVLAWLSVAVGGRWLASPRARCGVAAVVLLWTWWPGELSPDYWLGLAFQAPSVLTVLLCAEGLRRKLWPASGVVRAFVAPLPRCLWGLMVTGIVLGWLLVLDAFALLPVVQLYALGFSPAVTALVLLLVCLPWVLVSGAIAFPKAAWMPAAAVLAFVLFRLPSGNVWDAVLDPWLWLGLHGALLRAVLLRYRKRSS